MKKTNKYYELSIAALIAFSVVATNVSAQEEEKEPFRIEIIDIEVDDNVYTPYYEVRTGRDNERAAGAKWIRVGVEYETENQWVDDLYIDHYAIFKSVHDPLPILLQTKVHYVNVKPGRHISYVYLHPSYVERYNINGDDIDTAFRISMNNGDEIAFQETTEEMEAGWSEKDKVIVHQGHLLDHAETPFWFVNYDFRDVIKKDRHLHARKVVPSD